MIIRSENVKLSVSFCVDYVKNIIFAIETEEIGYG